MGRHGEHREPDGVARDPRVDSRGRADVQATGGRLSLREPRGNSDKGEGGDDDVYASWQPPGAAPRAPRITRRQPSPRGGRARGALETNVTVALREAGRQRYGRQ